MTCLLNFLYEILCFSQHWKFASEKKCVDFREWLEEVHGEVFEIGAGEFKESGTTVSTMAVVIKK